MTTFNIGREAEAAAAKYLHDCGYKIMEQNWRTRFCEIDIVAQKDNIVYFVEVKYRRSGNWGSGLEYITPTKLKQMHFAAEMWVHDHEWTGDYTLAAAEVAGQDLGVTNFISDL